MPTTNDTFSASVTVNGVTSTVTANFRALMQGAQRSRDSATSNRHSPYGNYNVIQQAGRNILRRTLRVYLNSETQMTNLESLVNAQGTLTYGEGTFTAVLDKINRETVLQNNQMIVSTDWLINGD